MGNATLTGGTLDRYLLDDSLVESSNVFESTTDSLADSRRSTLVEDDFDDKWGSLKSIGKKRVPTFARGSRGTQSLMVKKGAKYSLVGNQSIPEHESIGSPRSIVVPSSVTFQGPVRRKTILKDHARPRVPRWTTFWVVISRAQLVFYAPRMISNFGHHPLTRDRYRKKPCKVLSIAGWMPVLMDDPYHAECFLLQDPLIGHVYKFRVSTADLAAEWCTHLKAAVSFHEPKLPDTLITL